MSSPFLDKYSGLPQVSTDAVPQSLKPSSYPKPISCDIVHTEYQSSTSEQALGGSVSISVPMNPNMGLMGGQTTALKVQYTCTDIKTDTYFKGVASDVVPAAALNSDVGGTAYSLINRLQVLYNNAQAMNITNFRPFIDGLLAHGASSEFMARDASIMMGAGQNLLAGAGGVIRTAILPLPGLFASVRSLPLWAGSGNLQLNIDLNSLANAVYCVAGPEATAKIDKIKISLLYTAIIPPQEFIMAGKQQLQAGVYAFPYVDYQVIRIDTPASGSQNYMHPVGTSSLRSVHFTNHATDTLASNTVNTRSGRAVSDAGAFVPAEGLSDIRLVCDSKQINNYPLSSAIGDPTTGVGVSAVVFSELQKVFGRLYDSQRADNCTKANFDEKRFMVGISTLRFGGDSGFDLVGTPCSSCTLSYSTTSTGKNTQFVVYTMDKILAIDGSGSASILH